MIEIERKFLVLSEDYKQQATTKISMVQGFLNTDAQRTVRVRVMGNKGFLTVKGKSSENGTTRFEWEREISLEDARQLLPLCEDFILDKTRYIVPFGGHTFEVDAFHGVHKGLVIAEIELQSEDEAFEKPDWLGQEVTGDVQYYNSELSKRKHL
ncbi:CYTH domain-containing protein [Arenibacter sp. GZD96]|uniref:CYTH domain-containing protein n=1 Tax=Aurantibrevibacter litoralis TaxID=3106030 RepID=UPI002AFDEB2A|nr:CYTH domain-containing protein [Arenibacter sp. GZD-96]MEA1785671.1 CYTH domain-containing protein [Arenibacter sp. GZD-96]